MITTDRCEYCGCTVRSDERNCPGCGAENPHYDPEESAGQIPLYQREDDPYTPGTTPRTVAQLRDFCEQKGMPLEKMRFFIGEDYRQPRAFGIYRDGNNFVVYKNKGDGSRAVRYRGPDESYAVRELYDKLLDECHSRGIYPEAPSHSSVDSEITPPPQSSYGGRQKRSGSPSSSFAVVMVVFVLFLMMLVFAASVGGSRSGGIGSSNSYSYSYSSGSHSSNSSSWSSSSSWDNDSDWDSWDSWDSDWDSDW